LWHKLKEHARIDCAYRHVSGMPGLGVYCACSCTACPWGAELCRVPERPGDSRLLSSILTLLMRKRRGESEREPYPGSAQSGWGKGDWSRHQCSRLNSWLHTPLATTPSIGTRQSARPRRHPIVNPKTWASYAADHYQKKSQTIHQVDLTPLPGLWCKSCCLREPWAQNMLLWLKQPARSCTRVASLSSLGIKMWTPLTTRTALDWNDAALRPLCTDDDSNFTIAFVGQRACEQQTQPSLLQRAPGFLWMIHVTNTNESCTRYWRPHFSHTRPLPLPPYAHAKE